MLKRLLIAFGVLLAAAVAAVLVVPSFVDWNIARGWIAVRMGELAGRPVSIGGEVSFAMLPTPRLVAEDVAVAGEDGSPDLLTVRELELRVLLLPLLLGRIEVERLTLADPVLRLAARPAGAEPDTGEPAPDLQLGAIAIDNGTVLLSDPALGLDLRVAEIDAEIEAEGTRGPFQAQGRLTLGAVPAAFDLRTGQLGASGFLPVTLRLSGEGGGHDGRFAGLVAGMRQWQGDLTLQSADPAALLGRGGVLAEPPAALSQPFMLRASVQADGDELALNGMSAEFGETRGTGALNLVLGDPLRADLALSVNRIDMDGWPGDVPAPADLAAAVGTLPESGFALPEGLAATADLSVEAIRYRGGLARTLRLEAALSGGVLAVSRLSAQLPGGSDFGMIGSLRSEDGVPHVDLRAEAGSNDLRGALAWLGIELPQVPSAQLRRFAGTLALSGTPDDFRLTGVDLTVDNTRLTGGLAYVDRGVPGFGLRFDVDRANLDAYRSEEADWLADAAGWVRSRWPGILGAFNANVDGRIGALTLAGETVQGLRLDATLNSGALTLREASIDDLAGASARLTGSAARLAEPYEMDLRGSAEVPAPARLAASLGFDLPDGPDRLAPLEFDARLRLGEEDWLSLSAGMPGGSLDLSAQLVEGAGEDAVYDLTLRLRHETLRTLIAAGLPSPIAAGAADGIDLYAHLAGTRTEFEVLTVQGMLGPLTLAGNGSVSLAGERPRIDGELRTGAVPLGALLPPAWHRRADGRWPSTPLDLSGLSAFDGRLAVTARTLSLGDYTVSDPAAALVLADGALEIERLTGELFGGTLGLSGRLAGGDPRTASLTLDLVGADAAQLFATAAGAEGIAGTADFGFRGESAGRSLFALFRNAEGEGLVAVRDGRLQGISLGAVAEGLAEPGSSLAFLETLRNAFDGGETGFAALNAPFVMTEGVAESDGLRLAGELGVGEGRAAYDPLEDRLEAELAFAFYAHPEAPPIRLMLDGRPEAPVFRYRAEALQDWVLERISAAQEP